MEKIYPVLPDFTTYTKQNIRDNTLDDAQLVTRCPLDNGRYIDASIPVRYSVGQLDQLPAELLIQVLLYTDLPSLTRLRRVNRRAMELVDSVPQYAAIIKHFLTSSAPFSVYRQTHLTAIYYTKPSAQPDAPRASVLATISTSSTAAESVTSATLSGWNTSPHNRPRIEFLHSRRDSAAQCRHQSPTPTCGEFPKCPEPARAVLYCLDQ